MATITMSLSGSGIVNGSKNYTINDTDTQSLLDWAIATYSAPSPAAPLTNAQALLAWIQSWINGTKTAVQQFKTPAPVVPPLITIS